MARNIEDIQQDIERTRRQLAGTLDRLAYRTRPQTLVEDAKKEAHQRLQEPQVKQILTGVAAVVAVGVLIGLTRSRRRSKDLKELQRLLSNR